MSMEDILKVLVDSRTSAPASRPGGAPDPMTDLIGSLLGGPQQQPSASTPAPSSTGLGEMMGLLEALMGSGQTQTGGVTADPIMGLLQPFVNQLARKVNISPALATIVVSFVVHKLLAHHPTSGRDSTTFDLDDMLRQMSSGSINAQTLQSSGMVNELARATGLDHDTAARSLDATFGLLGGHVGATAGTSKGKKSGRTSGVVRSGRKGKASGPRQ